jgi:DNA-binding response OmpR family regulator
LSITRDLTELHGGRIWVQSEFGVGSTFTVLLPVADRKLPPSLLGELPAGAQKILVVDDERDIVALLRHQLEAKGYKVVTASTGAQAIAKAVAEQPSLITLDILLPDTNGFDVLRELKTRPETSHIPVIVLSVVQDEDSGYNLGAAGYITKPVDKALLISSVSHILGQRGKVLVAEDDVGAAEMLVDLLESQHLQCFHAVNGYETLSIARREQPGLILLDLQMPGMDGYEALTRLKKDPETCTIPILVMSAHAGDTLEERVRLKEMGAYDFFPKPFDVDELMAEIVQMSSDSQDTDDDT